MLTHAREWAVTSLAARSYRAQVRRGGSRSALASADRAHAIITQAADRPDSWQPPRGLRRLVTVTQRELCGWPVVDLEPFDNAESEHALVYLHGGGYVGQIGLEAWYFAARLAAQSKRRVVVPIYPLVPFITAEALVAQSLDVWQQLGRDLPRLGLLGDSAGGGLALSTSLAAREAGARLPERLSLISPWLDLTMSSPDIAARARHDVMLAAAGLDVFAERFAGSLAREDWRVSPLFAPLEGLPLTQVFAAEHDILFSDAERLAARLAEHGGGVQLHVGERMLHVWPTADIPEGREALARIAAFQAG